MGPTHSVDFPSQREGGLELPGVETGAPQPLAATPPHRPLQLIQGQVSVLGLCTPNASQGETITNPSKRPVPTSAVPYSARHAAFSLFYKGVGVTSFT